MLNSLRAIIQEVHSESEVGRVLEVIVERIHEAMGVDVCSVYLCDDENDRHLLVASHGLDPEAIGNTALKKGEGLVSYVAGRAEPINLKNAKLHPRFKLIEGIGEEIFPSFLGVPLISARRVHGVLVVQGQEERRFDEQEEAFLVTLGAQLAGVIAHADAMKGVPFVHQPSQPQIPVDARFQGLRGAPGIAHARAIVVQAPLQPESVGRREVTDIDQELEQFERALAQAREEIAALAGRLEGRVGKDEQAVFDAYQHMLDDNSLPAEIRAKIREGSWAQGALLEVVSEHSRAFANFEDEYLRERAADVRSIGRRLLDGLTEIGREQRDLSEGIIIIGEEITADIVAGFDQKYLKGIVSTRGSANSHVAILARALNVPTVVGAVDLPILDLEGQELIVDGHYGRVFASPSKQLADYFESVIEEEAEFNDELTALKDEPCETRDGLRIRLWVNIGLASDLTRSLDMGAEGIGLFRTEVPFMTSQTFPTEEEQRLIYREQMEAFNPRPVTMRTLDIGGDKSLSYFPIREDNPFLGWRGIRVTLDHPDIFIAQARAMIAANADLECQLRIMLPMISNLLEIEEACALIDRAYAESREEGLKVKRPQIGAMIEVPAAVYQARHIAAKLDFLAVGSNDLTQYMLAVDRNNSRVADLYQELHPAVIWALREVAVAAHRESKPIGICGEMAGSAAGAILLVAMGYDVLSMSASNIPRIKWVLRQISLMQARKILARVLRMSDAQEIREFMRKQILSLGLERMMPVHVPEVFKASA
ncbi:MAG: phosphoenolpyruvate--protein phosphotransferase [Gammaproteobacteria bacterium]|nr:phosphoenolpyruvate--protein phosphotransferase [Gammaproteobacteria bacterium]